MRRKNFVLLSVFLIFGFLALLAPAKRTNAAENVRPEQVLRQMADYLCGLPAFSCKLEAVLEIKNASNHKPAGEDAKNANGEPQGAKEAEAADGPENRNVTKMTVRLARPNRIAMIITEGVMGLTVVSDGKQLTQYLPMTHRYVVKPSPADYEGVTDIGAPMSLTMLGMSGGVIPTTADEFYKGMMDGVTKSTYVGQEKVGDVMCHHCRFEQEEFDWDAWIEVGNRPVLHKLQPDLTKQLAGGQYEGIKLTYVVTATDWDVAPKFTDADFAFTPPKGAEKGDTLFEMPEEPPHPLLGQPAPPFKTSDVDGHPIDLAQQLGKNVILLDFWATWCGPCVQAMPHVDEVAKKYADKGLVFYAVNVGEEAAPIKEFLATAKLNVPVAMNTDNKISELYQVGGIPQTLLIGKDGKVQVVHVGYSSQLEKLLATEIESLIAGKDLATEALKKAEESRKKHEAQGAQENQNENPAQPPSADAPEIKESN